MKTLQYRKCQNCQFAIKNAHGLLCCSLDGIVGVENYGCTPAEIPDSASFHSLGNEPRDDVLSALNKVGAA